MRDAGSSDLCRVWKWDCDRDASCRGWTAPSAQIAGAANLSTFAAREIDESVHVQGRLAFKSIDVGENGTLAHGALQLARALGGLKQARRQIDPGLVRARTGLPLDRSLQRAAVGLGELPAQARPSRGL